MATVQPAQPAPGWWMASDGRWYPPELHPGARRTDVPHDHKTPGAPSLRALAGWQRKALPYGGVCDACKQTIKHHAEGWHNPGAPSGHKVLCAGCGARLHGAAEQPVLVSHGHGVAGTSTLRDSARKGRSRTTWQKGATGEYLLGLKLREQLSADEVVLSNRSVPDTGADVDFIVVASSGVWVIDAKNWEGTVSYRSPSFFDGRSRLFVGHDDRSRAVEDIYKLVIPVANTVDDPSVPLHPALVFVEADWSLRLLFRRRPWQHKGVWITPPGKLCRLIREPGPLDRDQVAGIARTLDTRLAHR